jgi:glucose-6-phosphate 1-dehydrogenase
MNNIEILSPFLKPCENYEVSFKIPSFVLIIFGGAGDLSKKKLIPSLLNLFEKEIIEKFTILGVGTTKRTDDEYRTLLQEEMQERFPDKFNLNVWNKFKKNLLYKDVDLSKKENFNFFCAFVSEHLEKNKTDNLIYYLAIPPKTVFQTIDGLGYYKLCRENKDSKIIIEKPFGHDKKTARELNQKLLSYFDESQIYRIDHYLGKETIQNLMFFRFSNAIFEPLWNRNYVDHVQITASEDMGISTRGSYYEQSGVIKDFVQNHILQLISLIAMEPPVGLSSDLIRDERVRVLRSIRKMAKEEIKSFTVVGQYGKGKVHGDDVKAYREERGVDPSSIVPTFFSGKFYVDNWRWANVPFYVRCGKRLKKRVTEIAIFFKKPPLRLLGQTCSVMESNVFAFSIYPKEKIFLDFNVKYPGFYDVPSGVNMVFDYEKSFKKEAISPYERLLIDSMKGDQTLFSRQDAIEVMWDIVDPLVEFWHETSWDNSHFYTSGSWGPKLANELLTKDGRRWRIF